LNERWCAGLCERLLPLEAFRPERATCRECERAMARTRNRRRYYLDAAYRAHVRAAGRARYSRDPARRLAAVAARYRRLKGIAA